MLDKLSNYLRTSEKLMVLVRPLVKLSAKQFGQTRSLQFFIADVERELSRPNLFMLTQQSKRLQADPLFYVDIGARGGAPEITNGFRDILSFVYFEADEEEANAMRKQLQNNRDFVVCAAIAEARGTKTLYLTKSRGNSSLLPPTGNAIAIRGGASRDLDRFIIEKTIEITTADLASSMPAQIKQIDVLKIDVQGLEFEILSGSGNFRPLLLCIECSTVELYQGQKSMFKVGALLEDMGYMAVKMMEIQLMPKTLATFQSCLQLHGDVIFVPDNSVKGRAIIERDVEKWFAALCMHGYMDFALWQINELQIAKPPLVQQTEELLRNEQK